MQRLNKILIAFLLAFLPMMAMAQIDGEVIKPRAGKFLLQNATVVTITKGVLNNTSVLVEDGKIKEVGANISANGAEVIDCTGKFI